MTFLPILRNANFIKMKFTSIGMFYQPKMHK